MELLDVKDMKSTREKAIDLSTAIFCVTTTEVKTVDLKKELAEVAANNEACEAEK